MSYSTGLYDEIKRPCFDLVKYWNLEMEMQDFAPTDVCLIYVYLDRIDTGTLQAHKQSHFHKHIIGR